MSKLAGKLRSLSESSGAPIGFHPARSDVSSPSMLFIVGLYGTQAKEATIVSDLAADAGLIVGEGADARAVRQVVEAAGDAPIGVLVKGVREKALDELVSVGCDFVVFGIGEVATILTKKGIGRFLMIEPSLDQGLVRAINSFEVDGVLIGGGDSVITVERLLVSRRFVELLEKPVIMKLPSLVTEEELASLWQGGVDGVVSASMQSTEALAELKKMLSGLPKRTRNTRTAAGVVLPRYGGDMVGEEDEQEEESRS
jgi:hypothetical protein